MRKKIIALFLIAVMILLTFGCAAHVHKVGDGSKTGAVEQARQWYALWGLIPINTVDTNSMAGGTSDYTIKTEASALDIIINIFTQYVTVTSRTVTVTK